jgi:hypothetical protein
VVTTSQTAITSSVQPPTTAPYQVRLDRVARRRCSPVFLIMHWPPGIRP